MNRYVRGDNFQVGNAQANEYEFNTDLTYVVQSGAFKNISLRWRNVKYRGNHTVDRDGNRVIIGYTFKFW
ncbi:Porin-like protein NicP precursor [compost metagenome]